MRHIHSLLSIRVHLKASRPETQCLTGLTAEANQRGYWKKEHEELT